MMLSKVKATPKTLEARAGRNTNGDGSQPTDAYRATMPDHAQASGQISKFANGSIGRTVFVRNLLDDVTKQQLEARLESFGDIESCR